MEVHIPKAGVQDVALWLVRKMRMFRVSGSSMYPMIRSGDYIFVQLGKGDLPHAGNVVVFCHPLTRELCVKKVDRIEQGKVFVIGECFESTDSRSFGMISTDSLLGTVMSVL